MISPRVEKTTSKRKIVCAACRFRKKKCDGLRPACSSCQKWGDVCHYVPPSPSSHSRRCSSSLDPGSMYNPSPQANGLGYRWNCGSEHDVGMAFPFLPPSAGADFSSTQMMPTPAPDTVFSDLTLDMWTPSSSSSLAYSSADPLPLSTGFNSPNLPPCAGPFGLSPQAESSLSSVASLSPSSDSLHHEYSTRLLTVFFNKIHPCVPLLHCKSFVQAVRTQQLSQQSPHLYFAFLASCANLQPDSAIKSMHAHWYTKAKELYEKTEHNPQSPLPILQAAVLIVYHAWVIGDYPTAWLVLGRAWRQVLVAGYHRLDEAKEMDFTALHSQTDRRRHEEQARRVVWMLFILDRGMNLPVGLQHAIDERHLCLNLPLCDSLFQGSEDLMTDMPTRILYDTNLERVLASIQRESSDSVSSFHYVLVAYSLAGRISDLVHSPPTSPTDRQSQFEHLDDDLSRLRLYIPLSATLLSAASPVNTPYVVWLNTIINVSTILLHHQPTSWRFASSASSSDHTRAPSWTTCVVAAQQTTTLVQDASRLSISYLLNPHLAPAFYLCGRILSLETTLTQTPREDSLYWVSQSVSGIIPEGSRDLSLMLLVFDRMAEAFGGIGVKYHKGLKLDLQMSVAEARKVKEEGTVGLMSRCAQWSKQ